MSSRLVIEVEEDNDVCVLRLSGRVATGADDEYLRAKNREIKGSSCRNLLLDIRELHWIGSSGIAFFVDLYTSWTRKDGGRMVLAGPMPHVQEVLVLTRLSTIIPTAANLDDAIAFLKSGSRSAAGS
jgi:anti-anti-sigma factor